MTEVDSRLDLSPIEAEFHNEVRDLLARITQRERLARAAWPDVEQIYAWPSWSLDTGLSTAQEEFVEAWSPQQVLELCRSTRQLLLLVQAWTKTHREDGEVTEALNIVATLLP
jgi:hypothetical protein